MEHDLGRSGRVHHGHGMDLSAEFATDLGGPVDDDDDEDTLPAVPSVGMTTIDEGGNDTTAIAGEEEIEEERRLEKRSKDMLRRLRAHTAQYGWDEQGISLLAMCENNTKKQAASKFYTMLLLRKQGSVELFQEGPYTDIRVCRGPAFVGPSEG